MKRALVASWVLTMMLAITLPAVAGATKPPPPGCTKNCNTPPPTGRSLTDPNSGGCSGGVQIALPIFGNNTCVQNSQSNGGAVIVYLKGVLQLLSGAVGITIITLVIWAGIQYITSMGDPSNVKAAKDRLTNAITALVLFLMMFAILQFLVPGGIL